MENKLQTLKTYALFKSWYPLCVQNYLLLLWKKARTVVYKCIQKAITPLDCNQGVELL